jgi:uracil-DNA glycosylase
VAYDYVSMPKVSLPVVLARLREKYPNARYELDWTTPLDLLVATILAAQCTDERVNRVTKSLFPKYPNAAAYAEVNLEELEEDVKPTGFYRNKAKAIKACCRALVDRFGGEVPRTLDEMVTLPGVARKTANVVLNTAFNIPSGVIVDTHVARVSRRLGLTRHEKPEDIEVSLMKTVPRDAWTFFGPAMVLHGRYTCVARGPKCGECILEDICEKHLQGEAPAEAKSPGAKAVAAPKEKGKAARAGAPVKAAAARASEATSPVRKAPAKSPATGPARAAPARGSVFPSLPPSWQPVLAEEIEKPYFKELSRFLAAERKAHAIFPPEREVFSALELTPYEDVKVLLLGQDPYHDDDQAHGLCFSVRPGIKPPPSLVNIYKELQSDVGFRAPGHGYLVHWAKQGILMLNAVLTVRAHTPNSHKDRGWETFTDVVIRKVNEKSDRVVFLLWGGYAQKKEKLIDPKRHAVLKGAHPSPLSARNGFFGSKPFSAINQALREAGKTPIDWQLPDV